jgi:hypothetical protein
MNTAMTSPIYLMIALLDEFTASNGPRDWFWAMELITPITLVGLGIILYILHYKHQKKKKGVVHEDRSRYR